jgi:hypothetical protein
MKKPPVEAGGFFTTWLPRDPLRGFYAVCRSGGVKLIKRSDGGKAIPLEVTNKNPGSWLRVGRLYRFHESRSAELQSYFVHAPLCQADSMGKTLVQHETEEAAYEESEKSNKPTGGLVGPEEHYR